MKLHLSQPTRELIDYLDEQIIPAWQQIETQIDKTGPSQDNRLLRATNRIVACRREFDARLFFIVVFGPLKSGKSTLVNTLARQYVSPTRFARESTRRASIVIRGAKSGIQQFFWKNEMSDSSDQHRKGAFEKVIQFLRGVLTEESLAEDISIVDQPYDKSSVDRVLAGPLEREPLITVIRCPGGKLIGEEIAVLDVPGLDGFQTNTENNPAAFWIIDKSDLLIFTQSSFAPLNNQTSRYLRDLYDGSRKPPVLLVQNQIEARHWADPLEQQRDTDEQVSVARKEVSELLNLSPSKLPAWPINLGKAHDGYFKKMPELLEDSRFETFESELQKYLESSRLELHERNCLNEMAGEIQAAEATISLLAEEMDSRLKKDQIDLALIRQCRENIQNITYSPKWIEHHFNQLEETWFQIRLEQSYAIVRDTCTKIADQLASSIKGQKVRGKIVNQHIFAQSEKVLTTIRRDVLEMDAALFESIREAFQQGADHLESSALRDANATLTELQLPPLPPPEDLNGQDVPTLPGHGLDFETYQERRKILGFIPWPKSYPLGAVEEAIRKDLAAQWTQALDELVQKWIILIKESFISTSESRRRQIWVDSLDASHLAQNQKLLQTKESITEQNEALDQIHTQITAVKNRLPNNPDVNK